MVRGYPLLFARFSPFFQLFKNGSKRPKTTIGVVENDSEAFSLCFLTVFSKLKKWPKLTNMVRGQPLLFAGFSPFFQLFKNGSKRSTTTTGMVENDSKVFSLCFRTVFKKLKEWPQSTKMVRGYPLLFARFSPFFLLFKNGSKRLETTIGVVKNDSKPFSLCFLTVFRKFKKWPKSTKMVRGQPLLFARFSAFFQLFKNGSNRPKNTLGVVKNDSKGYRFCF